MYSKIFPDRLKCRINPVVVLTARFVKDARSLGR